MRAPSGLLLIDKPKGLTSHDVVLIARRMLPKGTKVGHTGTLDPMATGLLILVVGAATKSAALYQKLPKIYSGRIRLGTETDSGDMDGKILRELPLPVTDEAGVRAAMASFIGQLEMPPPMFSAVKYKGKPLYSYARQGIEVPLKNRTSEVFSWDLLDWAPPEIGFRLHCSHGTYARSLAVHLGTKLGSVAVLSALRREKIGDFSLQDAVTVENAKDETQETLFGRIQPLPSAVAGA